jgi:hypothetical protein
MLRLKFQQACVVCRHFSALDSLPNSGKWTDNYLDFNHLIRVHPDKVHTFTI